MSRPKSNFRVNDLKRAYRAAKLAGIERPLVELVLQDGAVIRITEQPETAPAAAESEDIML